MEKSEKLLKELKKLTAQEGILGSALIARNGFVLAAELPQGVDERRIGAMAATMLAATETLAAATSKGVLKNICAELEHSNIIVLSASPKALLVALAAPAASIASVISALKAQAVKIRELLGGD